MRFISVKEALDRSPYRNEHTIYRAIKKGELKAIKKGKNYSILESDFNDWMLEGRD